MVNSRCAIDAVITWVDGSDPNHAQKRRNAMYDAGKKKKRLDNGTYETRFANCGEIYWCVASILKYAPFVRRIFVVSDAQTPKFLLDLIPEGLIEMDRIRIVDHHEIFHGHLDALPTFSSLSIEAAIHHIDGLADQFLYFNDDFFLTAPMVPADFIDDKGRVILRGRSRSVKWPLAKLYLRRLRRRIFSDGLLSPHYKSAIAQSAKAVGLSQYFHVEHIPHILRKKTLNSAYASLPGLWNRQVSYKFRHIDQILPVGLANHLEIAGGTAQLRSPEKVAYMKPGPKGNIDINLRRFTRGETLFGCIQSFDEIANQEPKNASKIVIKMDNVFGEYMPAKARAAMLHQFVSKR